MNDFASTDVDREAVSFEEPEAAVAPEPETGEPKWAGTLPGDEDAAPVAMPVPAPIAPTAPVPEPTTAPEPVDPMELAETSHRKQRVELSEEPPLDQLAEDRRIAEAGRAAGWKPGTKSPDAEDRALKIGLWVVVALVALLVVGLCAGLGSSFLAEPEDAASSQQLTR